MDGVRLADDGAWPAGADNGPDEEGDARDGDDIGLDGEKVADLVDGEPDCGEGAEPEDEEGDPVGGGGAGRVVEAVRYFFPVLRSVSGRIVESAWRWNIPSSSRWILS